MSGGSPGQSIGCGEIDVLVAPGPGEEIRADIGKCLDEQIGWKSGINSAPGISISGTKDARIGAGKKVASPRHKQVDGSCCPARIYLSPVIAIGRCSYDTV